MITGKMGHMMQWSGRFNPMTGALQGPRVLMNPATAKHLGVKDEGYVKVTSPRGSIVWKARITETLPEKVIFVPAHTGPKSGVKSFAVESVNVLTNRKDSDPHTGFPAYSLAVCKVEPAKEVA
jgi:anaerobic selenocysteine-containing dehydrogenase